MSEAGTVRWEDGVSTWDGEAVYWIQPDLIRLDVGLAEFVAEAENGEVEAGFKGEGGTVRWDEEVSTWGGEAAYWIRSGLIRLDVGLAEFVAEAGNGEIGAGFAAASTLGDTAVDVWNGQVGVGTGVSVASTNLFVDQDDAAVRVGPAIRLVRVTLGAPETQFIIHTAEDMAQIATSPGESFGTVEIAPGLAISPAVIESAEDYSPVAIDPLEVSPPASVGDIQ